MNQRGSSNDWGIGFLLTLLVAMIISGIAAFFLDQAAKAGERAEAERQGKIVVSLDFFNAAESSRFAYERAGGSPNQFMAPSERPSATAEARRRSSRNFATSCGGIKARISLRLSRSPAA